MDIKTVVDDSIEKVNFAFADFIGNLTLILAIGDPSTKFLDLTELFAGLEEFLAKEKRTQFVEIFNLITS